MNRKQYLIVATAAIFALLAGVWLGNFSQQSSPSIKPPDIQGMILPVAKQLEPFRLVHAEGGDFSNRDFDGHWSLLFVGYTHCPDVCPITLNVLKNVVEIMQDQQLSVPRIIFISVDPERDTLETLGQYVTYFNQDFMGVTGSQEELARLAKQLGVFYQKTPGTSGDIKADDYLIDHSSSLILINPKAQAQAYLSAPHTPMKIVESILFTQEYFQKVNN